MGRRLWPLQRWPMDAAPSSPIHGNLCPSHLVGRSQCTHKPHPGWCPGQGGQPSYPATFPVSQDR